MPEKKVADEAPATVPQTTPQGVGYGHPEYHFVQAVMELQKSIGKVEASVEALKTSVDSTKSKVEDLVGWKNMIIGGAAVLGATIAILGFIIGKAWDYVTIKSPATVQAVPASAPPQPPIPTSKTK